MIKQFTALAIGAFCVGLVIAFGVCAFAMVNCTSAWANSGYAARWSVIGGCRVQQADGSWVPARNVVVVKP